MIACVKWRVRSRLGCRVLGVDSVWRGNWCLGRRRVTDRVLLALHRCEDEYVVHMDVKVAACNSQRLWSYARFHVVVLCSGCVVGASRSR